MARLSLRRVAGQSIWYECRRRRFNLKQLLQAGLRVFFYLEDRERTLGSPTDKIMLSLTTFADEMERDRGRQRTYDAMIARRALVTSPAAECRLRQRGRRAVVRRIFEMSAPCRFDSRHQDPKRRRSTRAAVATGQTVAWATSSVREVLLRPLYRGEMVWQPSDSGLERAVWHVPLTVKRDGTTTAFVVSLDPADGSLLELARKVGR